MLKISQRLVSSWKSNGLMVQHQQFSVFFMDRKQFDAPLFDVLIQDFDEKDLHGQISKILNKPYLNPLQKDQKQFQEIRRGIIFGGGKRGLIALPTRTYETEPIWVHYLIDTSSPYTFLTKSALKTLKVDETQNLFSVFINSHRCSVRFSTSHFHDINLLGMDYFDNRLELIHNFLEKKIKLVDMKKS